MELKTKGDAILVALEYSKSKEKGVSLDRAEKVYNFIAERMVLSDENVQDALIRKAAPMMEECMDVLRGLSGNLSDNGIAFTPEEAHTVAKRVGEIIEAETDVAAL